MYGVFHIGHCHGGSVDEIPMVATANRSTFPNADQRFEKAHQRVGSFPTTRAQGMAAAVKLSHTVGY